VKGSNVCAHRTHLPMLMDSQLWVRLLGVSLEAALEGFHGQTERCAQTTERQCASFIA
jgi:hypothetical protein